MEMPEAFSPLLWPFSSASQDRRGRLQARSACRFQNPSSLSCFLSQEIDWLALVPLPSLPPVDSHGEIQPELEEILQRWVKKVNNHALANVQIKWKGTSVENVTWEDFWTLWSLVDISSPCGQGSLKSDGLQ
jgi:hypothetical protein